MVKIPTPLILAHRTGEEVAAGVLQVSDLGSWQKALYFAVFGQDVDFWSTFNIYTHLEAGRVKNSLFDLQLPPVAGLVR